MATMLGDSITQQHIDKVKDKLSNRPRKCLGFQTPNHVFFEIKSAVALANGFTNANSSPTLIYHGHQNHAG
jgi:hypothetical protein|tara:strand:+ start:141 stop:353 length:213 start_codon:yes stop_codon:yes gene_type:complete